MSKFRIVGKDTTGALLQNPCSVAFIDPHGIKEATTIRKAVRSGASVHKIAEMIERSESQTRRLLRELSLKPNGGRSRAHRGEKTSLPPGHEGGKKSAAIAIGPSDQLLRRLMTTA